MDLARRILGGLPALAFCAAGYATTLYDGDDGATCDYYNFGAHIRWRHRQGDWRDARGAEQGPVAFGMARVRASDIGRTIAWDVTGLVRGWVGGAFPNDGLLISGVREPNAGVAVFHSREVEFADLRPHLAITLNDGTTRKLTPIADTTLDCTTYRSIGKEQSILAGDERVLLMQFDLSSIRGTAVTKATLEMMTTERQYGDSMLGVFRLDPPGASGREQRPPAGIAAAYPRDQGIESDRDVVMATGFESPLWPKDWSYVSMTSKAQRVSGPGAHGFQPLHGHALEVRIPAGGNLGLDLGYKFADKLGQEPEEIYFRYYLRLGGDWNPTTDGGKLPGISATYGKAGWGGRKAGGTSGWSMRGEFFKLPGAANPLHALTPIGTYAYHSDMEDLWGDHWPWSVDGLGLLERNRWYCIEQYFKVNRIGRKDGVFRAWVDGKLAFEKSDINVRETPSIRIEQVWLNVYYGGTAPSPADQHLFIDNVVIARRYIGPAIE